MSKSENPNYPVHNDMELILKCYETAMEKNATRPVLLDLRNENALTNYYLIVSASNSRQGYAIADSIRVAMKESYSMLPIAVDGLGACTWILMDYGFFFVHIFQEPTRELYKLEQLWAKAEFVTLESKVASSTLEQKESSLS